MFGGETVIYFHHDYVRIVCEITTHIVVTIEVPDHPTAAVELHQHGQFFTTAVPGRKNPYRDFALRSGNSAILTAVNRELFPL